MSVEKYYKSKARGDFDKAHFKATLNDFFATLKKEHNELLALDEVKYMLSPVGQVYRGLTSIPIDKIVGSEGRFRDFDREFLPKFKYTRSRWENIDLAHYQGVNLPPIQVYKIGDFYFVKDGNHRVSVARQKGMEFIDAEVVELTTRVKLDEKPDLKELVLKEEYLYFLEKTNIDKILPGVEIKVSIPGNYDIILTHIGVFRHILNVNENRDVPWEEAIKRWYETLYKPIVEIVKREGLLKRLPNRKEGDFYIWIMDHWHYLKKELGKEIALEDAAYNYIDKYIDKNPISKVKKVFLQVFKRLFCHEGRDGNEQGKAD